MTSAPFLVVGGGPSGLGCSSELAKHGQVLLFDRIPVAGGTAGWESQTGRQLVREAAARGVTFRFGKTALRYDGHDLLVASPTGFHDVKGGHLFFAGGLRPASQADLNIDGERPAGVLPATVAEHLLHTGTRLWSTIVLLGDGPWARPVATLCRARGTKVIAVSSRADWGDERVDWPQRLSVLGRDRITHVRLRRSAEEVDIPCDALILAERPTPNRNVAGAIVDGAPGVTFQQPSSPVAPEDRFEAGIQAARSWITMNGDLK
jgi:NADPH-dependent 2,4-dienoyl-CoA reductase/sulfur reductase-like enzyme